jgi:hypothetical protein
MNWTDDDTFLLLFPTLGIVLVIVLFNDEPTDRRSIDLEARECVQACIKAMQDDQVFPDFAAIVKECDARFGDGCKLIEEKE